VKDFELLVSLGVFNSALMNDAVYKFKRYEDASLSYTGINKHDIEPPLYPDEIVDTSGTIFEGAKQQVTVNRYERSPKARTKCLAHHGHRCKVCDLDFAERYGDIGRGFIHVHHLIPLADIGEKYEIDPLNDLIPVCPNCHAMLHKRIPPVTVEALRLELKP
jgi:5-methylcytosine-specific restriction enzyme A